MLLLNQTSAIQKFLITHGRGRWATALLFLATIFLTATIERENWPIILFPFAGAISIYGLVVIRPLSRNVDIRFWLGVALLARIVLVFTFPNLSDDLYRFIWDGHCTLQGLNPYTIVPSEFIASYGDTGFLNAELLAKLNSPDYHTVYPPLSQYIFAMAAWVGGDNWLVSSIVLKTIILLAECSTIWMTVKILSRKNQKHLALLYALNPLVIIELVGNIHFEGVMIWGMVAAYYILLPTFSKIVEDKVLPHQTMRNLFKTAAALVTAIFVKLIPVILVPFFWRRLGWRSFFTLSGMVAVLLLVLAIPFFSSSTTAGPADSLDLYFHTFEFNAGLYYVFRWFGFLYKGYNMIATIGTATSILTIALLAGLFFFEKKPTIQNWPRIALFALTIYLMLASIVHPWYICGLVALAPFTRFRYPVIWSALAFLSYSAYRTDPVLENLWLVGFEYLLVFGFVFWEWRTASQVRSQQGDRILEK
ncbi:MAG: hypothetical protein DRI69_01480 [Bacteroidetes bacterium]|nr:MAG: hypothetical protein DRI69_01480 [Bacteroidota bacterium]